MVHKLVFLTLFTALAAFGGSYPWLDPASFPQAMTCDTTGLIQVYKSHIQGFTTYKVQATPPVTGSSPVRYSNPVIDGFLEDNIWFHSETLLINSWEDAGQRASCGESKFFGPLDMHAIWRFMYSDSALYVGIEVHDDILDVDSLKSWARQDGIEISLDPWDWGEADKWKQDPLIPQVRRYWSPNNAIVPYNGGGHLTWFKFLKRMNDEDYLAGVIRGIQRQYYTKGDEVNNFTEGTKECAGIRFAAAYQGIDPWGRKVWHLEFKFPYHGPLWAELEGKGFYTTAGLPKTGTLFKMNMLNNDDDILGADGSNPNVIQMGRGHADPPWWDTHWSDNRFMMAMEYANPLELKNIAHPYSSGAVRHGDIRIGGAPWVSIDTADHADYPFGAEGTVTIGGSYYLFDSTGASGGTFSTLGGVPAGTYTFNPNPNNEALLDTLRVNLSGGTNLVLHRKLMTGYPDIEGRWVEARLVTKDNPGCAIRDSVMVPVSDTAREYRFTPLTKIYPATGMADSVRIYRYKTNAFLAGYTYTATKAISGRTKTHFLYDVMPKRIIRAGVVGAARNMVVRWLNSSGAVIETDTLMEIKPYNLLKFGETGLLVTGGLNLNKTNNFYSNSPNDTSAPSVWRAKLDKYDNILQLYMGASGSTANRLRVNMYDSVMLAWDSLKQNYWKTVFLCKVKMDSFELVGYDSVTGVASGGVRPKVGSFFPNGGWVQQCCTLIVRDTNRTGADTLWFTDTTHVWHWDYYHFVSPSGASVPRNLIDTATCPYFFPGILAEKSAKGAKVMTVNNDPNPFNPTTLVRFVIPGQKTDVRYALHIYDVRGSLIRTLAKGVVGTTGLEKRVLWDGTDNLGRTVSAGVYYYRLTAGTKIIRGTMVMVK